VAVIDPDAPWWANLLVLLLVAAIPAVVAWRGSHRTGRKLDAVAVDAAATRSDAAATRSQTENEHADSEIPNLRDELTATRKGFEEFRDGIREDIGGLRSEVRDLRRDVAGIRTDARRDRRELTAVTDRLDEHLEAVPQIVADAVHRAEADHVHACPLRQDQPTT
jgi:hypothetical protein